MNSIAQVKDADLPKAFFASLVCLALAYFFRSPELATNYFYALPSILIVMLAIYLNAKAKLAVVHAVVMTLLVSVFTALPWALFVTPPNASEIIEQERGARIGQEQAWIAEMQVRVRASLKDPSSAQFGRAWVVNVKGAPMVCGTVNSKNSFGGYAGAQGFFAGGDLIVMAESMKAGEWEKLCSP